MAGRTAWLTFILACAAVSEPEEEEEALAPARLWTKAVPPATDALQHYVSPGGKAENLGTQDSPWDLPGVLSGQRPITPGSIVWVRGGRYVYPVRDSEKGRNGFPVTLSGAEGKPIHLRGFPGERATIDGGFEVSAGHLWIWDLEFALGDDWRPKEPSPQGQDTHFSTPTGVLNVDSSKEDVKVINCISHNNHTGIGFWKFLKGGEVHGCIVYDNGFLGTDRPHGPALYTQNQTGTPHLITDNILGGNYSLPLQAYASKMDLWVNDFTIEDNIIWAPRQEARGRTFALCGGDKSKNMVIRRNFVYGHQLRVGSEARQVVEGNVIVRGEFSAPSPEKNTLILTPAADTPPVLWLRPNKYDPRRANLLVTNWAKADRVEADLSSFLRHGETYRILSPFDFYGKPLAEGTYDGKPVSLPVTSIPWALMTGDPKELGVYIVLGRDRIYPQP